jgi:hypothetical protein
MIDVAPLDESLEILTAAWWGESVHDRGPYYTVDGMRFLPRPVQRPGIPVWVGGYPGKRNPLRRAARFQGFFPVNLEHPDQLAEIVTQLATLRKEIGRDASEPFRRRRGHSSWRRPGAVRIRRCHLVAGGAPVGGAVGGSRATGHPRWTCTVVLMATGRTEATTVSASSP